VTTLTAPAAIGPLRFAAHYRTADPSSEVGGDWFDAVPGASGALLVVGDVQGHDEGAAELMCHLRAITRAAAHRSESPAEILKTVNGYLAHIDADRIVTALVVSLDFASRVVSVASAGHLPPLAIRPGGGARDIDIDPGPPLGIGTDWDETSFALDEESALFLYTDGLVEARGWPIDHGIDLLHRALSNLPRDTGLDAVLDAALEIIPGGSRDDDVALLAASVASAA
jgi:serine phosphatase RsbU (regulator of sigma subunit)